MCKGELELVNQRLLHYSLAGALWSLLLVAWALLGPLPIPVQSTNHLLAWEGYFCNKMKRKKALAFPRDFLEHFGEKETEEFLRAMKHPIIP